MPTHSLIQSDCSVNGSNFVQRRFPMHIVRRMNGEKKKTEIVLHLKSSRFYNRFDQPQVRLIRLYSIAENRNYRSGGTGGGYFNSIECQFFNLFFVLADEDINLKFNFDEQFNLFGFCNSFH